MPHLYLSYQPSRTALSEERRSLEGWCFEHRGEFERPEGGGENNSVGPEALTIIEEKLTSGRISQRQVEKLLRNVQEGDLVVATSLTRLGRSLGMLVKVLETLCGKSARLATVTDNRIYSTDELKALLENLEMASELSTAIKTERNAEADQKARSLGHSAGRPSGHKNSPEKTVLHGKTDTIELLLSQRTPVADIAARLGVCRGTIYNYIKLRKSSEVVY